MKITWAPISIFIILASGTVGLLLAQQSKPAATEAAGRFVLFNAAYTAVSKAQSIPSTDLFRLDTSTGKTSVFVDITYADGQMLRGWFPVEEQPAPPRVAGQVK